MSLLIYQYYGAKEGWDAFHYFKYENMVIILEQERILDDFFYKIESLDCNVIIKELLF